MYIKQMKNSISIKNIKGNKVVKSITSIIFVAILSVLVLVLAHHIKGINQWEGTGDYLGYEVTTDSINVPVLCYHSVGGVETKGNALTISAERFEDHIKTITEEGFKTLTMEQLYDYLVNGKEIPTKSVVITFDDGYVDNYAVAFPILKKYNCTATLFAIGDKFSANGFMSVNQLQDWYASGLDIQLHTQTHTNLTTLNKEEQEYEINTSYDVIQDLKDDKPLAIAYPEGGYDKNTLEILDSDKHLLGFTVKKGYVNKHSDIKELNRILVDYTYESSDIKKVLNRAN